MDARASLRMSLGYDSPATKPMGLLGVRTCDRVDQNPEDTATVRTARSKARARSLGGGSSARVARDPACGTFGVGLTLSPWGATVELGCHRSILRTEGGNSLPPGDAVHVLRDCPVPTFMVVAKMKANRGHCG